MDKTKYTIERRYINKRPNVRPGTRLKTGTPAFFVAHDTGNPGATADNHYTYFNTQKDRSASAHVFIDDTKILEIIPTGTGTDPAEKAWHVRYDVPMDNDLLGYDANDAALGIELCYGTSKAGKTINFAEAYKRFVWYLAYCCDRWGKNPSRHIPSHKQLDPGRKYDCEQALRTGGKTLKDLITDVATELAAPIAAPDFQPLPASIAQSLIDNYVSPAWFAAQKAGDADGKTHFHNLANNLRLASGIPLDEGKASLPLAKLPKSNAQEIIFRWLSPAWFKAKAAGDLAGMKHFNNLANYLRRAAGIPEE
ncbi:N-acetylmuramoyl-L-alanine amidase family protein [Paenibacillus macerans]|uniref:peptidoglycan recognition protein family protein n=1 Tax=Paenibacillus macerans TaxID=44252 RepID=UPI00204153B3|nr:N-acetylmuramoyl-L-alanine amidase [Paenibacillus macerans]MCM3699179.1 N-acetylmuramoyl-L-alanine amidase [Paenibacillus macerans]